MYKTCFKCGKRKSIDSFYKHPKMADGHVNKCIVCNIADMHAVTRTPAGRKRRQKYEKLREQTPERKAAKIRYQRNRRHNRPGANRAHQQVNNAVRDGRLKRLPCEVCGKRKTEAHHDDYRKPLTVRWLCFEHHRKAHGQTVN